MEPSAESDPRQLCRRWLAEADDCGDAEPRAMALATATAQGRPSVRMVYYKEFGNDGLLFVTNFESRKGAEMTANPRAAVAFFWSPLMRQLRIEGAVVRADDATSDRLFHARARRSRLGAWASPQSRPIPDRAFLGDAVRRHEKQFGDRIPRPPFWGAFRLIPDYFEFWQGREARLHDRFAYTAVGDGWRRERLGP